MQGEFWSGFNPISPNSCVARSNQCLGLRLSPYNVRLSSQYEFGGVNGHPGGGRNTYISLGGRVA